MVGRSADDADFAPGLGHVQDLDNAGCVRVAVASLTMARHDNRRGSEPGCAVVNNQLFTGSHLRRTCPVRNFRAGRAAARLQRFQSCGNRPFCIVIHSAFAVDRNAVSIRRIADGSDFRIKSGVLLVYVGFCNISRSARNNVSGYISYY